MGESLSQWEMTNAICPDHIACVNPWQVTAGPHLTLRPLCGVNLPTGSSATTVAPSQQPGVQVETYNELFSLDKCGRARSKILVSSCGTAEFQSLLCKDLLAFAQSYSQMLRQEKKDSVDFFFFYQVE